MNWLKNMRDSMFRGWMAFAHVLGIINTTLLLTAVYVVMVLPMRAVWWIIRKDPLQLRHVHSSTQWQERDAEEPSIEERSHPF
ncbi:MAG: hypothetical protein A2X67_07635 [Ignavibacteria bacterium GWA2_55_11]|nr:MAG: hypothetical protein A2X67_07635 [Ignavibacteria bacterium GWA2_55_11]OGU44422.1 MAG: hypothetical protein A2X68_11055 [Ignavibacteria bacterium GWC2_56_12]OGU67680.1 MAG: hypothetical protein A3C56_12225 [Ignavibacteria bacterium RIFCSPHIGHO2_02_FULL_56_12]OGU74353.1 MAG: hypothetical protein A3G43_01670 [Ignavibacteria bacterium RIFCSPLOWO2_12_FULL_56_21]HAV23196.1 hypothetical protein [Bacteroidota bacterium]